MIRRILLLLLISSGTLYAIGPTLSPVLSPGIPTAVNQEDGAAGDEYQRAIFDGDAYASMTNAVSDGAFDFGTGSFTISAWVFRPLGQEGGNGTIWNKGTLGTGGTERVTLRFDSGNGAPEFFVRDNAVGGDVVASSALPADTWSLVAGIFDITAGFMYIYVDGVSAGTPVAINGAIGSVDTARPAYLGVVENNSVPNLAFNTGRIANLRVWKGTALSAPQALAEAQNTDPFSSPGPQPTWASGFQSSADGDDLIPYEGDPAFTLAAESNRPEVLTEGTTLPPTSE